MTSTTIFKPNLTPIADLAKASDLGHIQGLDVLITGGAQGLGAAITRKLCEEGATVTIADKSAEHGKKLEEELRARDLRATFIETDVTSWSSQVQAFKAAVQNSLTKRLDLVIPCAGTPGLPLPLHPNPSLNKDPPAPETITIDVTLTGVYYSTVLALHYFRLPPTSTTTDQKPSGRQQIIFIGSLAGYLEVPPIADYNSAKFGVRGLWKSIRREIRDLNIRSNLIAPTFLPTQAISAVVDALQAKGAKIGKIEDAVNAVVLLAADEGIDGRAIAVGGDGCFDLRDDSEGFDGGKEVLRYFKEGGFGRGMHDFKEILAGRSWS